MHRTILDNFVLISNSLLIVCCLINAPFVVRMWSFLRVLFLTIVFGLVLWVPIFKGCRLAQIMRGALGDVSIATNLVLLFWLYGKLTENIAINPMNKCIGWVIFLLGCILYASSLGFVSVDIYSYGYLLKSPAMVLVSYAVIQLILWQFNRVFALIWLVAMLCYILKLQSSINLWDYLFDPVLWFISFCTIVNKSKKTSTDIIFEYY